MSSDPNTTTPATASSASSAEPERGIVDDIRDDRGGARTSARSGVVRSGRVDFATRGRTQPDPHARTRWIIRTTLVVVLALALALVMGIWAARTI